MTPGPAACRAERAGARVRRPRRRRLLILGAIVAVPAAAVGLAAATRSRPADSRDRTRLLARAGDPGSVRRVLVEETNGRSAGADAWVRLAEHDYRSGAPAETVAASARRALQEDPARTAAWLIVAELEARRGRAAEAVSAAEAAAAGAPPGSPVHRVLGELRLRTRPEEPAPALDALRRGGPGPVADAATAVLVAEALLRVHGDAAGDDAPKELASALADARRLLDADAFPSPLPESAAWVALAAGLPARAVVLADRLSARLRPEDAGTARDLDIVRGRAHLALGRSGAAMGAFRAALHRDGEPPPWRAVLAVICAPEVRGPDDPAALLAGPLAGPDTSGALAAGRAIVHLAARRLPDAEREALAATSASPDTARWWVLLGEVRSVAGAGDRVLEAVENARAAALGSEAESRGAGQFAAACRHLVRGDVSAAASALAGWTAEHPADAQARCLFGLALMRCGDSDRGIRELLEAAEADGSPDDVRRDVVDRLRAVARSAPAARGAEQALRDAARVAPDSVPVLDDLCVVLLRAGRADEAARVAEDALGRPGFADPLLPRLRVRAAHARLVLGDVAGATRHLSEMPAAESGSPRALVVRGLVALRSGDAKGAAALLERAWRGRPALDLAFAAALEAALTAGDAGAAERLVTESRSLPDAGRTRVPATALALARHRRFDTARRVLAEAGAAFPHDPVLARIAVSVEERAGDTEAARRIARRFAAEAPAIQRPAASLLLAELLAQSASGADEARDLAAGILAACDAAGAGADPSLRSAAQTVLAEAALSAGDAREAERAAASVIEAAGVEAAAPTLVARCRFVLGGAAYTTGRAAEAERHLAACLEADPRHAAASADLAWVLAESGREPRRALGLARAAAAHAPGRPEFQDTRAVCAAAADERAEAEECWRLAIAAWARRGPAGARRQSASAVRLAGALLRWGRTADARVIAETVLASDAEPAVAAEARRIAASR